MAERDVVLKVDAETAKAVDGFLRLVDAQKKLDKSQDDVNKKGKEGSGILHDMGISAEDAAKSARSMITSFLSFEAAVKFAEKMVEALKEQKKIAGEILKEVTAEEASLPKAAARMGFGTGPEGIKQVDELISNLVKKTGASGADVTTLLEAVGTSIAGGSEEKTRAAGTLANFMTAKGIGADEAGSMATFLREYGDVSSAAGMEGGLGKISAAAGAAGKTPGEFFQVLQRGASPLLSGGMGMDQAMAVTVQAIEASRGNQRKAAGMLNSVTDVLRDPDLLKLMSATSGKSAGEMSQADRLGMLGTMVGDKSNRELLEKTLKDKLPAIQQYFEASSRGSAAAAAIAHPEAIPESELAQTAIGRERSSKADTVSRRIQMFENDQYFTEQTLLREAGSKKIEELTATGARGMHPAVDSMFASIPIIGGFSDFATQKQKKKRAAAIVQLERLGESTEGLGVDEGMGWNDDGEEALRALAAAKKRRGIPDAALIGTGGATVMPTQPTTVINQHVGNVYATPRQSFAGKHPAAPAIP